jgi:ribulose 1,5-bisphosphate carboxylase large subunit-like protein
MGNYDRTILVFGRDFVVGFGGGGMGYEVGE